MQLGSDSLYKCPKCGKLSKKGTLLSGNSFGSTYFSDGKQISPMMPEFPSIVKCKKCKSFYWLNDENEILPEIGDGKLSSSEKDRYLNYVKDNLSCIEQGLKLLDDRTEKMMYPNKECVHYFYVLNKDNNIVVIELMGDDEESKKVINHINHLLLHKAWAQENLAVTGQEIKGIILCYSFYNCHHLYCEGFKDYKFIPYPFKTKNELEWEKHKNRVRNVEYAEYLSLNDWYEAINSGIAENKEKEIYLRKKLWWVYNDRVRNGEKLFVDRNDEAVYKSNCIRLIELLDKYKADERIMVAELYRNIEDYDQCINTLERIMAKGYKEIRKILKNECNKRNRYVIEIE